MIRLLPDIVASGPVNMAADETLLEGAAAGRPGLRVYGWTDATLSLGYFQSAGGRFTDERLAALPWVRRPSGGGAIVHHLEVTYCLALPAGRPWQTGEAWLTRMHGLIAAALAEFGVTAHPYVPSPDEPPFTGFLCFQHFTPGDLMIDGFKVAGSAQRRSHKALMQHGSILLAASPHAPMLPGVRELSGRDISPEEFAAVLQRVFVQQTGWPLILHDWTDAERQRIEELAGAKYGHDSWNGKR